MIASLLFPVVRYCVVYDEGLCVSGYEHDNYFSDYRVVTYPAILVVPDSHLTILSTKRDSGSSRISLFSRLNEQMNSNKPSERAPDDSHFLFV